MSISILSTKLYVPPARPNAIARPRLSEKLLAALHRPGGLVLLSGPAGFGKTTLLSEFVTQLQRPVRWVSLDEADNDPIRFWTYLIAACQSVQAEVGQSALELLPTPLALADDTIPTILINDLARRDGGMVLVLDDYQVINNPSIHGGLSFLLDHLPEKLHLILSTRVDPPWPLARFRARNQLIELRAADLGFTTGEAAAFLNHTMGLNLSPEEAAALEARTEGWIAGLQLAALSMKGRSDVAGFVKAFTGSHVYVAEYLVDEVLQRQPQEVQAFLLQTSILERMSIELCDAVTGRRDAQAILTTLHRANLFVIPLDDQGQWFRYHHLFADLLQARLPQSLPAGEIAVRHTRVAAWYEHNGFAIEAVKHALAAKDFERVASPVEQAAQTMMFTGQFNVLRGWLASLPDASFHAHPRLTIYSVLIDLSQANLDMSEQSLLEKEGLTRALPPSPENDRLRVEAMVLLCPFLAHQDPSRAIQIAHEALAQLPEGDLRLRAYLFSALYRAYGMDGDAEKSEPAYQECLRLAQAAGHYDVVANTTMVRAFDLGQYGRLREAAQYCRLIIKTGAHSGHKTFYPAGPCYIGLACVHLEWNDLETAEAYFSQGMELCRQAGMDGLYTGYT
jgi:LuxR family transcriptional regulator, maltose regulon positive regulatory protein